MVVNRIEAPGGRSRGGARRHDGDGGALVHFARRNVVVQVAYLEDIFERHI